jgi:hypothetical protein
MYNRRIIAHKDSSQNVQERNGMLCYVVRTLGPTASHFGALHMYRIQTIDGVTSFNVKEDEVTEECEGYATCLGCAVCDPIVKHPKWG